METNPVKSRGGGFAGERGSPRGKGGRGRGGGGLGVGGRGGGRFGASENFRGGRRDGTRGRGRGGAVRGGNGAGSRVIAYKDQDQQNGDGFVDRKEEPQNVLAENKNGQVSDVPAENDDEPIHSTLQYLRKLNPHVRRQRFHEKSPTATDYEKLKVEREIERKRLIEIGAIDDPEKPKPLDEAIDFVGTCEEMCPFYEAVQRSVQAMLDRLEKNPQTQVIDLSRTVKTYHRPAAGMEAPLPSDVRTPRTLVKTLDYLMNELVGGEEPLIKVHPFVRDRTRSIRQDFTLQNYWGGELVACTEIIARFHIVALHKLCDDTKVFSIHQELEQLSNCLTTLIHCYNDSRERVQYPNEPEFRAYQLIFHLYDPEVLSMMSSWPEYVRSSNEVRHALRFVELVQQNNASEALRINNPEACTNFAPTVFRLVRHRSTPYLLACLLETHFEEIRRAALKVMRMAYMKGTKRLLIEEVSKQLGYETPDDLERALKHYGINIGDVEIDGQTKRYIVVEKGRPWRIGEPGVVLPSRSHFDLVESKIAGRCTILDAIYGYKDGIRDPQSNLSKYPYTTPVPSVESRIPRALRADSPARNLSRTKGPLPLATTKTALSPASTNHTRLASPVTATTAGNTQMKSDLQKQNPMLETQNAFISSNGSLAKISPAFGNLTANVSEPFGKVDPHSVKGFASQQYPAASPFAANMEKKVQPSLTGPPLVNPFKPVLAPTAIGTAISNDVRPSAFGPLPTNASLPLENNIYRPAPPPHSSSQIEKPGFFVPGTSSADLHASAFLGPTKMASLVDNIFKPATPAPQSVFQSQTSTNQQSVGKDDTSAEGISVFEKLRPVPTSFHKNIFGNLNAGSSITSTCSGVTSPQITTIEPANAPSVFDRIPAAPAKFPENFFGKPNTSQVPDLPNENPRIVTQKTTSASVADNSSRLEQSLIASSNVSSHTLEHSNVYAKEIGTEHAVASLSAPDIASTVVSSTPTVVEPEKASTKPKPIISHALAKELAADIIKKTSERRLAEIVRKALEEEKAKAVQEIAEKSFNDGLKQTIRSVAMDTTADAFFKRRNLQGVFTLWRRKQRKITYRKWGEKRRRNPPKYALPQWRPVVFPEDCTHSLEELEQFTKLVYQSVPLKEIFLPKVEDAFWHTEQSNQRWRLLISNTNEQKDQGNYWWIEKFLGRANNHVAESRKVIFEAQFQLHNVEEVADIGGFVFGCSADYEITSEERFARDKKNLHDASNYLLDNTRFERLALTVVCYRSPLDNKPADILGRDVDRVALNGRYDRIKAIEKALDFESLPNRVIHREIILAENIPDMDFTPAMRRMADSVVETVNPKIAKLLKPNAPRVTPRKDSVKTSTKAPENTSPPSAGAKRKRVQASVNSTTSKSEEPAKRSRMQNAGMATSYFQLKARGLHLDWKNFPMPTGGTIGDIGVQMELHANNSQQIQGQALYIAETPQRQHTPSLQSSSPLENLRDSLSQLVSKAGEVTELLDEKWAETEDVRREFGFMNGV